MVDPTSHWQCDVSKDAKLGLRSFVNPALIPLHARAGPNLELHTTNVGTSQWLQRKLTGAIWLNEDELDLHQSLQCPVGLLVSIDSSTKKTGAFTSDYLVYGVLSAASSYARPPTPPRSSPSDTGVQGNESRAKRYTLRVYAAPLSTSLLNQAQSYPSPPPSSEREHVSTQAEFLPDISSPSPKRKRVATLFEVAAQHHRRVRQRGGEAVSQLMAPSQPLSSSQNLSLRVKREPDDEPSAQLNFDRIAARRSRSVSVATNLHRPGSTRGTRATPGLNADPQKRSLTPNVYLDTNARRGSQHMQTLSTLSASVEDQITSTPNSPPKNPEAVIAENKNLITRTILTCMRLYGFHRSNARSSMTKAVSGGQGDSDPVTRNSTPVPEGLRAETPAPAVATTTDDEEFKNMYHATYRAAAFALRKYLKESSPAVVLEKDKAMTCIDELLRIFCEEH